MENSFLPVLLLLVMLGSLSLLTGCNTTAGAGADVRATGQAITHAADDVKSKL